MTVQFQNSEQESTIKKCPVPNDGFLCHSCQINIKKHP